MATSTHYDTSGEAVRWHRANVGFAVDPASVSGEFASLPDIVASAAERWSALPGVARLTTRVGPLGELGYSGNGPNVSGVVVFHGEPTVPMGQALAITLITTRRGTGEVLDADVMFNAGRYPFAALGAAGMLGTPDAPWDIANVATHELGHVLGLGEDYDDPTATMYPTSARGEVSKRELHDSDRTSVEAAYADATVGQEPPAAGCGGSARVAPQRHDGALALGGLALGLLALGVWRMRQRRGVVVFAAGAALVVAAPLGGFGSPSGASVHRVASAQVRHIGGVLVTEARVVDTDGVEQRVELAGGVEGDIEQRVHDAPSGGDLVPGARVELDGARVVRIHVAPSR